MPDGLHPNATNLSLTGCFYYIEVKSMMMVILMVVVMVMIVMIMMVMIVMVIVVVM